MNADGHVYGRYGGRDAKGADTRNSLAGLRYAMEAVLAGHRAQEAAIPPPKASPLYIEKVPAARGVGGCIHCHQAKEILRQQAVNTLGKWDRESRWVYPLPENLGVTLDLDKGNLVKAVAAASPAAKAGMQAGDVLIRLNNLRVHSFADAQYALHKAPAKGAIPVAWERAGQTQQTELSLTPGWKKTNITWRPSLMDLLPSLPLFGTDLTPKEKETLGLPAARLAFRQDAPIPLSAEKMGVRENDVIVGVDDLPLEMTVERFLGYVRQSYLIGDRITLNLLRDGKRLNVPITLK
jgi:membrane-associated protease RseP (regulator of RpoE activity)